MSSRFLVYALTDPMSGCVRYIGKSTSGLTRPKEHGSSSNLRKKSHLRVVCWVKALVAAGLSYGVEIVEEVDSAELLNDLECFHIASIRAAGAFLLNDTDGGDGGPGYRWTNEQKARLSAIMKASPAVKQAAKANGARLRGIPRPPHVVKIIGDSHRGKSPTEETRTKIAATLRGNSAEMERIAALGRAKRGMKLSADACALRRQISTGRRHTEESRTKLSRSKGGRPIADETGRVYRTAAEAARALSVNRSHVLEIARGKGRKTTHGHTFCFAEESRNDVH